MFVIVGLNGFQLTVMADGVSKAASWFGGAPIARVTGRVAVGKGLVCGMPTVQLQLGESPGMQEASILA